MNKTTRAITDAEYELIITTIRNGYSTHRPNARTAAVLVLEANTGMRIGDIMQMKFKNIVKDGKRYRLDITEEKTGKKRTFTIHPDIREFVSDYCRQNGIKDNDIIFPVSERIIQRQLKECVEWLGIDGSIGTHSFRKYFGTSIYEANGNDVRLVQELLQHSSPAITSRYLSVSSASVEAALSKHCKIV